MARLGDYAVSIGVSAPLHFVDAVDRDTGLPSPAVNDLSVLDATPGVIDYWDGSAWRSTYPPGPSGPVSSVDGKSGVVTVAADYVNVTGDTMTGALDLDGAPLNLDVATRGPAVLSAKVAGTSNLDLRANASGIGIGVNAIQGLYAAAAFNVAVGASTIMNANPGPLGVVALGYSAMVQVNSGSGVGIGFEAGFSASNCADIGYRAGKVATGNSGVFIGNLAGTATGGTGHTMVGDQAGKTFTTATNSTFIGAQAGINVSTSSQQHVLIGQGAGNALTNLGGQNVFIGVGAAAGMTTAASNVLIGSGANGDYIGNGAMVTVGASTISDQAGIAIGYSTQAQSQGGVAVGVDDQGNPCIAAGVNEIKFGTALHTLAIDGPTISFSTAAGTKIGSAATQKFGLWGATPIVRPTGWSVTSGYTATKAFDPETATLRDVARVLGTFIDQVAKATGAAG